MEEIEDLQPKRDLLIELGLEDSIVFEKPHFDSAIIGYDANDYRVIYDYELMVTHLMEQDGMTYEEASEFIQYNTIMSIPYCSNGPIVLHSIEDYYNQNNIKK